ncbi:MAG: shikimate kinase, partial [Eggerthellaceae bacterium]|nr:shikimate kinase [Eggerthellaceae bacterium]
AALESFLVGEPKLISCGGGIVCGKASCAIIRERGLSIYLYVSPDESAERISNHDTRPFFETMDSVREVNAERVPVYEDLADRTVDTTGRHPGDVAREVKEILVEEGVLCLSQK